MDNNNTSATRDEANRLYRNSKTNYRLKNGSLVRTRVQTVANRTTVIPAGSHGVVVEARTPKVIRDVGSSLYFANVEVTVDGSKHRIRVPHGALAIISITSRSAPCIKANGRRSAR